MKWITSLFKKEKKEEIAETAVKDSKSDSVKNSNSLSDNNLIMNQGEKLDLKKRTVYTDEEIREYIRVIVTEAKNTAKVDTGFLKRSIRGNLFKGKITFRQIYYGAENGNSQLAEIAQRLMPKDLEWKLILQDDEGKDLP